MLIIQNDKGNKNSHTTIIAPITTHSSYFVTHVYCRKQSLDYRSKILLEQIRTIDKCRIEKYICALNPDVMKEVDDKIKISLALNKKEREEEMNELQIFKNDEFGDIRTTVQNGEAMFCLTDVCRALGLTQPSKVKERLSGKGVNSIPTLTNGGTQNLLYINEPNLYRTIFQSRKESAERFTDWVTEEVLPSIRKTGWYQKPMTPEEMMRVQLGMIDGHEERISKLENTMNIDYGQQRVLEKEVAKVVIESLDGKDSNAYREVSKKVFSECNHDIKDYFHVNSRNNIPRLKFEEAIDYIRSWTPCSNTRMLIRDCNAQMVM